MLVLSRLDKAASHSGDGHYAKTANFLTGLPVIKTPGTNLSVGGPSIDQLCAERIGHLTPLPSLELAIDPVASGVDGNVGYTRLYASYISWRSASMPMAREINPRVRLRADVRQRGGSRPTPERGRTTCGCSTWCWKTPAICRAGWAATIGPSSTNIWIRCARSKSGSRRTTLRPIMGTKDRGGR